MKTDFLKKGLGLLMVGVFCVIEAMAGTGETVKKNWKVGNFSSIEFNSVAQIFFVQSDKYSMTVEGKQEEVANLVAEVKGGCLYIDNKKRKSKISARNQKQGVKIYLSAPTLEEVRFSGVGTFYCKEPMKLGDVNFQVEGVGSLEVKDLTCDDLTVSLSGVGSAELHVDCADLDASVEGIGSVTLSGKADRAHVERSGIGSVNTKHLKVDL